MSYQSLDIDHLKFAESKLVFTASHRGHILKSPVEEVIL